MKKRKLFTLVAAVSILGSSSAALLANEQPVQVQAAKKSKKKTAKYPQVLVKRGVKAYGLNKDGKIYTLKSKKKTVRMPSVTARVVMSLDQNGTTYYFIKFGKSQLFVRAKDTKRLNNKTIPSYTALINQRNAELNNLSKPTIYVAKTNAETSYWNTDGKVASDKLPAGTQVAVIAKIQDNQIGTIYQAILSDNKTQVLVPAQALTFVDSDAPSKVLSGSDMQTALNNYNKAVQDIINKYQAKFNKLK